MATPLKNRTSDTPAPPTGRRRAVFTILAALIPVLFFLLLEGGLRLAGYGATYPLFVEPEDTPGLLIQNREVARRYFYKQENIPSGIGDIFEAEKSPTALRIFVQGGSSAAGFPYYFGGAFSRMLQQRLQQGLPDRRVEVINTSMAAVNSYTLLDFVGEIIAQQPDAVLVYAGHNEFYGALGVGSAESLGRSRAIVRLYLALQSWRSVQLLRASLSGLVGVFAGDTSGAPGVTMMERMVADQEIARGSPKFEAGLSQFEANLTDLVEAYQARGIPVFVGTLASNERDHPPFLSKVSDGTDAEAWAARIMENVRRIQAGAFPEALADLDEMAQHDTVAADVQFLRGRALDALAQRDKARSDEAQWNDAQWNDARNAYRAAKDRDRLRFRAAEAQNDIIRRVAASSGAILVDVQSALAAASPGGIIDGTLMLEHLHPNVNGYFLMADAFYEAMRPTALFQGVVPTSAARARQDILLTPVDSLMGSYRVLKLMGSWPFEPTGTIWSDTLNPGTPTEEVAVGLFRGESTWLEATNRLGSIQRGDGDFRGALRTALAQIQQYPFYPTPYAEAGDILMRQGRKREALGYFRATLGLEDTPAVRGVMGDLHTSFGEHAEARDAYQRGLELQPANADFAIKLARSHAQLGDNTQAGQVLRDFIARNPDDTRIQQIMDRMIQGASQ